MKINHSLNSSRRDFLKQSTLSIGALGLFKTLTNAGMKGDIAKHPGVNQHYICVTCGAQFAASENSPERCPICLDERQYVGLNGQEWTTLDALRAGNWKNAIREQEPGIWGIGTEPKFAIGQRALLIQTQQGNVLWDCVSFLDEATISAVKRLGGISAIAISHPHYYSSMVEWSRAFGGVPIYLHEADRQWVQRPDKAIQFWRGETKSLGPGLTLVHTAGHFDGFQVLHWEGGAGGKGVIMAGDQPTVAADPKWVSFMYSYPNFIPLNTSAIRRIVSSLEPYSFERLYGAFWHSVVTADAKGAVRRSGERYMKAILE